MKISILGDGAWGTAIALQLIKNKHNVVLWGAFPDYIEEMKLKKENTRFLKNISLPETLTLSSDIVKTVNHAELIILATPTQFLRTTLLKLKKLDYKNKLFLDLAKGIEIGTLKFIGGIVKDTLGEVDYSVMSGPSHAEEVSKYIQTALVVASKNAESAKTIQDAFLSETFRVYTSNDVIGVELGGALKNIYAIAVGICDGMKFGDNPKAALMTRAIVEMGRLGESLGGKRDTFSGLAGIGDLIVTCTSGHSRNRFVGEELGKGNSLTEIEKGMGLVIAEGVKTTVSAFELAKKNKISTPIIDEVYFTLFKNKDPKTAIRDLMTRPPKAEM